MSGLGIDIRSQIGVVLDVEPRPNKSPRAFCAAVRSPGEVYLVIAPSGGWDDYSALFHESGHTEHFAHVDPSLPFEFRCLGDSAITECFAFLFQHLVENPEWLARHLGIEEDDRIAGHARAQRLVYLRRYPAKLAYELELHTDEQPLPRMAERYSELLGGGAAGAVAAGDVPGRRRSRLLLCLLPPGLGARDPSPPVPGRSLWARLV